MKKLSILCGCTLILSLMTIPALAQQYEVDAYPETSAGDMVMDTELTIGVGESFCFDVYLTESPVANPGSGGVWIAYTGSGSLVAYVSATDAIPPWTAGPTVN